ncbi:MAG: PAS domain S-box protein, partial [Nitrospirota bacterium]
RAEDALMESEERFRQVAENIREVFWMTDPEKKQMIYVSPAYADIWGRSCESLYASPRSWLDAIHPDDRTRVLEAALTRQASGEYDEEYRIVRPDGAIRWIHDRAFPIRDHSGKVYRIAGIAACITERKQAQEALRRAYDKMEKILASLPGAILIVDQEQQVVYANPLAEQHFGSGRSRLVGSSVSDVLPVTASQWHRLINGLKTPAGQDENRQHDGEFEAQKRTYQYRLFPVNLRESVRQQTGIVIWDVTEQKQIQDQLIQTEKLASLGTLVFGMAHEINNPVQGILGMAEIIREENDPEKVKEYAGDIVDYSKHVSTVVRDFAAYARMNSCNGEVEVDLRERLVEAVKMVQRNPQFGHVEVVTQFQPVRCVRARQSEIDQVFINLICNAAQAMDGRGRLTLATEPQGNTMKVLIADTGCGMPKAVLNKIFDPFFTTKDPGEGTGLGLSIAHKIVTKYGGTIGLESEEGKGTTFTIQFPVGNN